jgi:ACS family hexuronate transporter-like MFS transporter
MPAAERRGSVSSNDAMAQTAVDASRGRTLLLVLLALVGVINYADLQSIAILKPLIERSIGWTDADYGRVVAMFQLATALSYLWAGAVVDRLGVRRSMPVAVASFSIADAAHALARTTGGFMLARIGLGASESLTTPAIIQATGAYFAAARRARVLGWVNSANSLGAIITPLIIPTVALTVGWRGAFVLLGIAGLVWTGAWMLMLRRSRPAPVAGVRPHRPTRASYLSLLRQRRTWAIIVGKALADQVWWLLLYWTPSFLHRTYHLSVRAYGGPLAVMYAGSMLGSIAGGWASSRLVARGMGAVAARLAVMAGCAVIGFALFGVPHASAVWTAVALLTIGIAALQGFSVNVFTLITDVIESERVGTVTSLGAFAGNIAGMAVVWWCGVHLAAGGGYAPFFDFAAVSFALAFMWLRLVMPRRYLEAR